MTIKEKFLPFVDWNDLQEDYVNRDWAIRNAERCEQIADEFAIEFAEWLRYNCVETDYGWQNHGKQYSDTEILKLFKEEKGL